MTLFIFSFCTLVWLSILIHYCYTKYKFKRSIYYAMIELLNWYKYDIPLKGNGYPLCKTAGPCSKCP